MPHSYTSIIVHYVFSPLGRHRINSIEKRKNLNRYICGICHNLECKVIASYVMPDHVHLLVHQPAKISIAELAQKVKGNSSRHLNTLPDREYRFVWQEGYGAFSCSYSQVDKVANYIKNQEEHHKKISYEDEYQSLIEKHNLNTDD